jgi:hypothetical protein
VGVVLVLLPMVLIVVLVSFQRGMCVGVALVLLPRVLFVLLVLLVRVVAPPSPSAVQRHPLLTPVDCFPTAAPPFSHTLQRHPWLTVGNK